MLGAVELLGECFRNNRLAAVEFPHAEFVDFALEIVVGGLNAGGVGTPNAGTEVEVSRRDAAQVVCVEVGVELTVDVDLSASAGAVHGYGSVVPVVVVECSGASGSGAVVAECESAFLVESEAELVERVVEVAAVATSVGYDCSVLLTFFSLEPQFHGVVHRRIDYARAARRDVEVASAVELNSTTFRHNPSAAIELEVSTVSLVREHVAAGFAHRVVSQEVAFGAREQGEAVSLQASRRNHLVPDACVVHVSCEVVFAVDACAEGVGAFAVEAVGFNFADVFNKVIECAHFFFAVVGHCHVSPSALVVGNLLVADDGLVAHFHFEAIVGGDAQFNSAVGCALAEQNCILWLVGKNPHFHGERLVVPVAVELGGEHVVFAVETNRNRVVGLRAVANAGHLKVVVGEQAFGNSFVEVEANFVVHC